MYLNNITYVILYMEEILSTEEEPIIIKLKRGRKALIKEPIIEKEPFLIIIELGPHYIEL